VLSSPPTRIPAQRGADEREQRRHVRRVLHWRELDGAVDHAITLSSRVETGTIAINGFGCQMVSPFGGVKSSGLGRGMGPEGLNAYIELQSVLLPPAQ
jgi:acyl-CoA reductase-like NAD-dependent aldehyde dehydrogenase